MSEIFTCDDKDTLVAYLYEEVDAPARKLVDDHLRTCVACANEVRELRSVRGELMAWAPPEPQLGFTIVRDEEAARRAEVLRPARWWPAAVPAWAQAAAAVLVLAAGAAIANVQIRYDASGLAISTGWMTPAAPSAPVPVADGTNMSNPAEQQPWQPALASLGAELRDEMRRRDAVTPVSGRVSTDADVIMRRVASMIAESEQRQQQELARRLVQVGSDFDVQRRADLMRISQALATQTRAFEGQTGELRGTQRQMLDYIVRTSQPQQ